MAENKINKVVIFCGGKGTRLAEFTTDIPKPLVPIGGDPVVLHIMRKFYAQGYREFVLALGYKSQSFKTFFRDYSLRGKDVTFSPFGMKIHDCTEAEEWTVHLVETGEESTTGQRLHGVKKYLGDEDFFLTYGDCISNVDLLALEKQHYASEALGTITAVPVQEKFGVLSLDDKGSVTRFAEKSDNKTSTINGGFIACRNELLNHVNEDSGDFSFEALTKLADAGKLDAFIHEGFWHPMDSKKDNDDLNKVFKETPKLFGY